MDDLIKLDAVVNAEERQNATGYIRPKAKPIQLRQERYESLLEMYKTSVVHDHGDDYHLSDEERIKKNAMYAAFIKIRAAKRKYVRLNEYVVQMRRCMECLEQLAEINKVIYPKDQFIKDVLSGKIHVMGLEFPKYKGKDRKTINWEFISEYVADTSKDPDELVRDTEIEDYEIDTGNTQENLSKMFDDDQLKMIFSECPENIEDRKTFEFNTETDDTYDGLVFEAGYKDTKKLIKDVPEIVRAMRDIKRYNNNRNNVSSFIFGMQEDDFNLISELDKDKNVALSDDVPQFKGDIMDDTAYDLYMYRMKRFEESAVKIPYHNKMKTLEEIEDEEVKRGLEDCGYNIRAIYGNREREKKMKEIRKKADKKTKELKARLIEIKKRTEFTDDKEFKVNDKKKKDKKGKVKGNHKKNAKKAMNGIIMDATENGKKYKKYSDYKKSMENFEWKK